MAIAIELQNITRNYCPVKALDNVSLKIEAGEFFTLLGPSGSGKSTLLKIIGGFEEPSEGRILFNEEDVTNLSANQRPSNTVFQDLALFPHMSVGQNVAYGLRIQKRPKHEINQRVIGALDLVGLAGFEDRNVNLMSGGQRQRVALARSLIMEPGVLLLDEPLTGLDEQLRQQMRDEFGYLHEKTGATFILVTHNQDEALSLSDRMVIMKAGQAVQVDTPKTFFEHPKNSFVAGFMGMECLIKPDSISIESGVPVAFVGCAKIPAANKIDIIGGRKYVLAIRPDQISFGPGEASEASPVKVQVKSIRYRGLFFDIHTEFSNGEALLMTHPVEKADTLPVEGDMLNISFAPGAPLILLQE